MNISSIIVRYAKAIYQAATEENALEKIYDDICMLSEVFDESAEFNNFINSPTLKISQKNEIFITLFKEHLHALTLNFLLLLVKNKRERYLKDICRNFKDQYKTNQGIIEAVITTTYALSDEERKKINTRIEEIFSSKIELSEEINETLIGGFKLKVDDHLIDASISSQLNKIKRELINS